jgi:hypothetical protein
MRSEDVVRLAVEAALACIGRERDGLAPGEARSFVEQFSRRLELSSAEGLALAELARDSLRGQS